MGTETHETAPVGTDEDLSYMEHLIDDILPAREVHFFAGPSGAGKTTLLMKMLETFLAGEPYFGHGTHPTPFVYISSDRSKAGMYRTTDRAGVNKKTFPLFVAPASAITLSASHVIEQALKKYPKAGLVVFEGLATYVPGGKLHDYQVVAKFLRELGALCEKRNITILGVVHSPKAKEKDKYTNPRERIMGSAAWGAYAESILFVEPVNPDGNSSARMFWILPRNAKEERFTLDWKDGLLVPTKHQNRTVSNYERFMAFLAAVPDNEIFTKAQAEKETGIADSSLRFELKKAADSKVVLRVDAGNGTYRKLPILVN